jgi:pimeloyl-ACP methyl ester carboxylesterase
LTPSTSPKQCIREQSGYRLASDGSSLYLRVYRPTSDATQGPVVLVPADGEERTWAQRAWVNLARHLARSGSPVIRFDFRGQGESDGEFETTDVSSRLDDLSVAVEYCRESFGAAPILVGLRLGANLAARVAGVDRSKADRVIAVEPLDSGRAYVDDLLKRNVANQFVVHRRVLAGREKLLEQIRSGSTVNCNGFLLAAPLVNSLLGLEDESALAARPEITVVGIGVTKVSGTSVEGVAPFWIEAPTFRSHPEALFEAVAALAKSPPAAASAAPARLLESSQSGGRTVDLDGDHGPVCATWHGAADPGCAVLFMSPGPNDRAGPHGLYGRLARGLAAAGRPVLRIDPVSVGESHGDDASDQERSIADVYREINEGRHVPDAECALEWLRERGFKSVVITGLCGGASTAMLTAAKNSAKDLRLVLLGTPVLHQGVGAGQVLTDQHIAEELALIRRKLFEPTAIWRLLTFRSDYRVLFKVVRARIGQLVSRSRVDARLHPQTNRSFLSAWERFRAESGKTTFVYSEFDRLLALFKEHFAPLVRGDGLPAGTELVVLEKTNHNVTDREAERRLLEVLGTAAGASH